MNEGIKLSSDDTNYFISGDYTDVIKIKDKLKTRGFKWDFQLKRWKALKVNIKLDSIKKLIATVDPSIMLSPSELKQNYEDKKLKCEKLLSEHPLNVFKLKIVDSQLVLVGNTRIYYNELKEKGFKWDSTRGRLYISLIELDEIKFLSIVDYVIDIDKKRYEKINQIKDELEKVSKYVTIDDTKMIVKTPKTFLDIIKNTLERPHWDLIKKQWTADIGDQYLKLIKQFVIDIINKDSNQIKDKLTNIKQKEDGIKNFYWGSGYYGNLHFKPGDIIKDLSDDESNYYYYVLDFKSKYFEDDGLSFGVGDDRGYMYTIKVRKASDVESEEMRNQDNKKLDEIKNKNEMKKITDNIEKNGEIPTGMNIVDGDEYIDTFNIYGGGSKIVINKYIWYIKNNGRDGDDWSQNNVKTGGAGAIGYRIPYDTTIAKIIISESKKY